MCCQWPAGWLVLLVLPWETHTSVLYSFSLNGHTHPCGSNFWPHADGSRFCTYVPHPDIPVIPGMAMVMNMSIPSVSPVSLHNPSQGHILGTK